jgi:hypothetical protein
MSSVPSPRGLLLCSLGQDSLQFKRRLSAVVSFAHIPKQALGVNIRPRTLCHITDPWRIPARYWRGGRCVKTLTLDIPYIFQHSRSTLLGSFASSHISLIPGSLFQRHISKRTDFSLRRLSTNSARLVSMDGVYPGIFTLEVLHLQLY